MPGPESTGLDATCVAALGYVERTVAKFAAGARYDQILHACSSTNGSRKKLKQVLAYAVKAGRIGIGEIEGKTVYTAIQQTTRNHAINRKDSA